MTLTLSQADYLSWLNEASDATPDDATEEIMRYPTTLGQGQQCSITLRQGIDLIIDDCCLNEDLVVKHRERLHPLEYSFEYVQRDNHYQPCYHLYGSGLAPADLWQVPGNQRIVGINVHIEPQIFEQWVGSATADPQVSELLRPEEHLYLEQTGTPTAAMQIAVQQILRCPFQGLTQRLYLESKVWELMALLISELTTFSDDIKAPSLKPDDIERIHYASKLLCCQMLSPPSLMELARAVGINDHKLKVGFRQVFGTTVFGHLHEHRMEQSRQLLESGDISVTEAAQAVGFASRGHFAAAFRRRYGVNPGVYARQRKA